jgi:hypothetical protein
VDDLSELVDKLLGHVVCMRASVRASKRRALAGLKNLSTSAAVIAGNGVSLRKCGIDSIGVPPPFSATRRKAAE